MRLLVAIATCRPRRAWAKAQRATWASRCPADVRFFIGGEGPAEPGEVALTVDDFYVGLPAKVKGIMAWALANGYDSVLKLDDDVYLAVDRVERALRLWESHDYAGNFRMRNGPYPADYASGFSYWLGRRAVEIIAAAPLTTDTMEDRWVGNTLAACRPSVRCLDEKRFLCTYPAGIEEARFLWGSPVGKTCLAIAQYPAEKFADLDYWYRRMHVRS